MGSGGGAVLRVCALLRGKRYIDMSRRPLFQRKLVTWIFNVFSDSRVVVEYMLSGFNGHEKKLVRYDST